MLSGYSIILGVGLHLLHFKLHAAHMRIVECTWITAEDEVPPFDLVSIRSFSFYRPLMIPKGGIGCAVLIAVSVYQTVLMVGRFKLYRSPKSPGSQIVAWFPSEFESTLFIIHSPAHSMLWLMVDDSNWLWSFMIMAVISWQVRVVSLKHQFRCSFRVSLKSF